jgi:hypothetical protein
VIVPFAPAQYAPLVYAPFRNSVPLVAANTVPPFDAKPVAIPANLFKLLVSDGLKYIAPVSEYISTIFGATDAPVLIGEVVE